MPIAAALAEFKASVAQCESLIMNAHKNDTAGQPILPLIDREQITIAAFLNMFIGWETFLEACFSRLMTGAPTIGGTSPTKYVSALSADHASRIIIGSMKYFDYGNHERVCMISELYFENGYPIKGTMSAVDLELRDLRTMRNSSAHLSSSTQKALEALAIRIFGQPKGGIRLYDLLTAPDPRQSARGGATIFQSYKDTLVAAAELIAQG